MKPRWLLLAVSVICLVVLAPASALSVVGWPVGCGTAKIDGVLGADEWAPALALPLTFGGAFESAFVSELGPAQPNSDWTGYALGMNDGDKLYFAAEIFPDFDEVDPDCWEGGIVVEFGFDTGADPEFGDTSCNYSTEGFYHQAQGECPTEGTWGHRFFAPLIEDDDCHRYCDDPEDHEDVGPGVAFAAAPTGDSMQVEASFDLTESHIKLEPGDCLRLGLDAGAGLLDAEENDGDPVTYWDEGWWPANLWEDCRPDTMDIVCLNECEPPVVVEDFVPEPATIMLMGSGLLGLAGYAGLRLRRK